MTDIKQNANYDHAFAVTNSLNQHMSNNANTYAELQSDLIAYGTCFSKIDKDMNVTRIEPKDVVSDASA